MLFLPVEYPSISLKSTAALHDFTNNWAVRKNENIKSHFKKNLKGLKKAFYALNP